MTMSKLSFVIGVAAMLASCSPQMFTMTVEMRHPSKSGLNLAGKSISVVYLEDKEGRDSVFAANLANGFASALEKDYFNGDRVIDVYKMIKDDAGNYNAKDTLTNLVMQTSNDVVFLFDTPQAGEIKTELGRTTFTSKDSTQLISYRIPMTINLYAYDSMGKDTVRVFSGNTSLGDFAYSSSEERDIQGKIWKSLGPSGVKTGERSAENFLSTWKTEQYTLYYFSGSDTWSNAAQMAYEYKWNSALKEWMKLLSSSDKLKRACAEYNIATACYMLGDYNLALKWLDQADRDNTLSLSNGLRARINRRMKM